MIINLRLIQHSISNQACSFEHILTYISNRYLKINIRYSVLIQQFIVCKINDFHCSMRLSKILGICALLFEDFSIFILFGHEFIDK